MEWNGVGPSGNDDAADDWHDATFYRMRNTRRNTKRTRRTRRRTGKVRWWSLRINKHTSPLIAPQQTVRNVPPPPPPSPPLPPSPLPPSPVFSFVLYFFQHIQVVARNNAGPLYDLFVPFFQVAFNPETGGGREQGGVGAEGRRRRRRRASLRDQFKLISPGLNKWLRRYLIPE